MCTQNFAEQNCPGFDCVNALELFTCCTKVTPIGKMLVNTNNQTLSEESIGWFAMENDEKLGTLRRNILLLKDRCRQIGTKPQILCPQHDFPYALKKEMRAYVKNLEGEYKANEEKELQAIEQS